MKDVCVCVCVTPPLNPDLFMTCVVLRPLRKAFGFTLQVRLRPCASSPDGKGYLVHLDASTEDRHKTVFDELGVRAGC